MRENADIMPLIDAGCGWSVWDRLKGRKRTKFDIRKKHVILPFIHEKTKAVRSNNKFGLTAFRQDRTSKK